MRTNRHARPSEDENKNTVLPENSWRLIFLNLYEADNNLDYDLDGRLDLLRTYGHVEDEINVVQPSQHYEQPTQLFWNCGPRCARDYDHAPLAQHPSAAPARNLPLTTWH